MRSTALIAMVSLLPAAAACTSAPAPSSPSTRSTVSPATSPATSPARGSTSTPTIAPTESSAGTGPDVPCTGSIAGRAPIEHVVWIVMENHTRAQVFGDARAPYVPGLAKACATASDYRSVGSPSLPNYLGLTSGSTHGIHDDASPATHPLTVDNLFRQVRASGRRAVSYEESMPGPCTTASSGRYAVRHNPAAYYTGADDRDACARDDIPLGTVDNGPLADAIDTDALPTFTFITPDLCHDTHDCAVAVGDAWLAAWLPRLLASAAYRRHTMVIFIAWDEPSPMPFVAITPTIAPGTTVTDTIDHYALLRVTEELLGLPLLGAAGQARDIRAALGL